MVISPEVIQQTLEAGRFTKGQAVMAASAAIEGLEKQILNLQTKKTALLIYLLELDDEPNRQDENDNRSELRKGQLTVVGGTGAG